MSLHNIEKARQRPRAPKPADSREKNALEAEREALSAVLLSLRRNAKLIALTTLIGSSVIAGVVMFMLAAQYQAVTTILVDSRKTQILKDQEVIGRPGTDNGAIESEAEVMKSPNILHKVVEQFHLDQDEEFVGSRGPLAWAKWMLISPFTAFFGERSNAADERLATAADALKNKVQASRRNLTYVIELSVWSESAAKAAKLADKIAGVYLAEQVLAKSDTTRRATQWLNEEAERMRARLIAAENAYESYKAEAGLFNPGGENLTDRQIGQLNEQLVIARASVAEAEAKYEQLRQINAEKLASAAASPDVLQSTVLTNLRNQYADVARKQAELKTRYGPRHPQVISVNAELENLSRQIRDELDRIVASARTELEMAKSRQASLNASLEELKVSAAAINHKAVKLRELEREVQANKSLYEAVIARAKETDAQLIMQLPDSRILAAATVPLNPSYPKKSLMIGLGFFGSLGLAVFVALVRGVFSEGFRRASDLQTAFGLRPLATIPLVEAARSARPFRGLEPVSQRPGQAKLARLVLDASSPETPRLADYVIREPNSAFAESIHSLRFALRQAAAERRMSVILVTSALPGEGKSTVSANLGRAAAMYGDRVLLIDADLRRPSLAVDLGLPPSPGLVGLARDGCNIRDAILQDHATSLHVMAGMTRLSGTDALTMLASRTLADQLTALRPLYDLILIDTSPLLPVADPRLLVNSADGVAFVVASEQTTRGAVRAALQETPGLEAKILGAVMNRVADDYSLDYPEYRSFHKVA
jgi:capsular exopolysaccharide synthesis family protein